MANPDRSVGDPEGPPRSRPTRVRLRPAPVAGVVGLLVLAVVGLAVERVRMGRANARLEARRFRAEANFRQARGVVETYLAVVSASPELKQSGLQSLRRRLLEDTLRYYNDFLKQVDGDPEQREDSAAASFRVGTIELELGRPSEASASFRKAVEEFARLSASKPDDRSFRAIRSRLLENLGTIAFEQGRPDEASRLFEEAIRLDEALAAEHPEEPEHAIDLGNQLANLGRAALSLGDRNRSLALFRRSLDIRAELADGSRDPALQLAYGRALANVGGSEAALGRQVRAADAYREARKVLEALLAGRPDDEPARQELGLCLYHLGVLERDRGAEAESRALLDRARETLEGLTASNPEGLELRRGLAQVHEALGGLHEVAGRSGEAIASYGRAVALLGWFAKTRPDLPGHDRTLQDLAMDEWHLGSLHSIEQRPEDALKHYGQALEILEGLAAGRPRDDALARQVAGCLDLAARQEQALGRLEDAERMTRQAIVRLDGVIARTPGNGADQGQVGGLWENLGSVLLERGDGPGSEAAFRHAIAHQDLAIRAAPDTLGYRWGRISQQGKLARALQIQGKFLPAIDAAWERRGLPGMTPTDLFETAGDLLRIGAEAPDPSDSGLAVERAVAILEGLVRLDPSMRTARVMLGAALEDQATRLSKLGRGEEAIARLVEAIGHQGVALEAKPADLSSRRFLSNHYGNLYLAHRKLGRVAEALAAAEGRHRLWAEDGDRLMALAGEVAACLPFAGSEGQRDALADRAFEILRRAIAAGDRIPGKFWASEDTLPLRARADFASRRLDLAFPTDPFAR